MRAFIGLDIEAKQKLNIENWRDRALPPMAKAVPAANFHITLSFLGQIQPHQLDYLGRALDEIDSPDIRLCIDQVGYFSKAKVLWIGPKDLPSALMDLAALCHKAAKTSDIAIKDTPYRPHITLARKIANNPPAPIIPLDFEMSFKQFHLFESVSGEKGVHYPIRQSWDLKPKFGFR